MCRCPVGLVGWCLSRAPRRELATNGLPTTGTNRVEWTDTASPEPIGFYAAA